MRRILDVLLGVVALAAGVCLISLLSNDCTHSIACMGSTTPMHAPSVTGRMLELVSLTVASAVLARTVWILRTTRRACAALITVATPSVLASSVARTGIQRVRCVATSPAAAFCHGVLRPTVVIETAALETLSGLALDAVLLHEAAHVRHHDPLRRALRQAVRDVGCRSSLFEWWSRRAVVREELQADAWAARRVGGPAIAAGFWRCSRRPRHLAPRRPTAPPHAADQRTAAHRARRCRCCGDGRLRSALLDLILPAG
jgi:hypothetical protein